MKHFLPVAAISAAAVAAVVIFTQKRHERDLRKLPTPSPPPTPMQRTRQLKREIENYIRHAAIDKREVVRKQHLIGPAVHDHCYRQIPRMLSSGASSHEIKQRCIAIAEKICNQLYIQMKPRCRPMLSRRHKHGAHGNSAYAVNIYELDYNHVPTPNRKGGTF
jgi:hypothetical protein